MKCLTNWLFMQLSIIFVNSLKFYAGYKAILKHCFHRLAAQSEESVFFSYVKLHQNSLKEYIGSFVKRFLFLNLNKTNCIADIIGIFYSS